MIATGTELTAQIMIAQAKRINKSLAGEKFGRWTLVEFHSATGRYGRDKKWLAKCDCGVVKSVYIENILRGKSTSCGCLRAEELSKRSSTHRHTAGVVTSTYRSWYHMKGRCLNKSDAAYGDYGGRGITVCKDWAESFEKFLFDMGECPKRHSIERIDVNGNYEPGNCKWIDVRLQARNMRSNKFSEEDIPIVRSRLLSGESASDIGRDYGVSAGHIRQIKRMEIWK